MFIVFSLIFLLTGSSVDEYLAIRDFDSALEIAEGSDSLTAQVFSRSGNYPMATMYYQRAFDSSPSADLFCKLWGTQANATEHFSILTSSGLREELTEWSSSFVWSANNLNSLVESAMLLQDSLLADSLLFALVNSYPGSLQGSELIGGKFFDEIYPVWYDDSARVVVLESFIETWGDKSELWLTRAWQYTLAAVTETADSVYWEEYFLDWQMACPDSPVMFLSGASYYIDQDSSWTEALELAEYGLKIVEAGWFTEEIPPEEWLITIDAIEAGLQFRRLFALAGLGQKQQALAEVREVIRATEYDLNDYHTEASLYWLEGKLLLASGDTVGALGSFAEAAIAGEVRNHWSGMAIEEMDSLLSDETTPIEWAREYKMYSGPVFIEVTQLLGSDSLLSGSRVSWCDWNSDRLPDLYVGHSLFQNIDGNSFVDVTASIGLDSCWGNGGIWGDVTNDGLADLVTSGRPVQVFINIDDVLVDKTEEMNIDGTDASVEGVALLDWNADGWLDLYLASYENGQGAGTDDAFYLGSSEGFSEVSETLGMIPFLEEARCGRGVSPCDYDLDGDVDIFVSNYRLQENFLWENFEGNAVNSTLKLGVAGVDIGGWWGHTIGSSWADYDNDGDWDLFSANLAHPRYIGFSDRSMLLQNNGDSFNDVRKASGIKFEETHSNPLWADFNNDGLQDLFITSIYPDRRSFLYLNMGDGFFEDVTWLSGARVFNGWGAATADYNLDGSIDLVIGSGDGPTLLQNVTTCGNWLLVEVGYFDNLNRCSLGAVVRVKQDDYEFLRQVEGGSGTTSQNSSLLHFGLPLDSQVKIEVFIPGSSEIVESFFALPESIVKVGN